MNRVLFQPCRYILVYRFTVSRRPVLSRASWPPKSAEAGPGALSYFRESPVTFSCRRIVTRVPPSASKYLPVTLYFLTPRPETAPHPFVFSHWMHVYFCDQASEPVPDPSVDFPGLGVSSARIRRWAQGNNGRRYEETECDKIESNTARGEASSNDSHKAYTYR